MSELHDPAASSSAPSPTAGPVGRAETAAARRPWHGRMLEDASLELDAFRPGGRVFAIASAGCTAMALARRGDRVTAVDVHPGQIELVRGRLDGAPTPEARTDRWLSDGRRRLFEGGAWSPDVVDRFLSAIDLADQVTTWNENIASRRFRALLRAALARPRLAGERAGFPTGWAPDRLGARVERRLARSVATHPNRWNPYLWWLLRGRDAPGTRSTRPVPSDGVSLHTAEACHWLETHPEARFDGFTLSNVLDGATPAMRARLFAAVRRAAAPGAKVVLRTLDDPRDEFAAWYASRDRSGIWGGVRVATVASLEA